jgi:hypothetical protein
MKFLSKLTRLFVKDSEMEALKGKEITILNRMALLVINLLSFTNEVVPQTNIELDFVINWRKA